jgi:hypothetical protein
MLRANRERAIQAGKLTRLGVPNGWAGQKEELGEIRRNSQTDAERLAEDMEVRGVWVPDCLESRIAMREAVEMAINPLHPVRVRLAAMRVILEYAMPRPMAQRILVGTNPLDFLNGLTEVARNGGNRGN